MIKYIIYAFTILMFATSCKGEDKKQFVVYRMKYDTKIEKTIYKECSKVYSISYSSNGWQIGDSTVYSDTNQLCYSFYSLEIPQKYFNIINKDNYDSLPRNYEYRYSECSEPHILNLRDSLGLSYTYLSSTESLLRYIKTDFDDKINYIVDDFNYKFSIKDGVSNTAIIYSVPPDAHLLEFGFKKQNGLIISDYFKFEQGLYAQRKYTYKDNVLDTVYIEVRNNLENRILTWEEHFEVVYQIGS